MLFCYLGSLFKLLELKIVWKLQQKKKKKKKVFTKIIKKLKELKEHLNYLQLRNHKNITNIKSNVKQEVGDELRSAGSPPVS